MSTRDEPSLPEEPGSPAAPEPVGGPCEPMPAPGSPREREPFSFDRRIKECPQHFAPDLVAWLLHEKPLDVAEFDPKVATTHERTTDKLLRVKLEGKPELALHIEFQTEGRGNVPERVARFLLLAGTSKGLKERRLHLASFVIYLDRKTYREDPGYFELLTALGTSVVARYTVVKLWEEDPGPILEQGSPGLCPFLPLMRGDPKTLFVQSRQKIEKAPESVVSEDQKRILLTTMTVLAGRVIQDQDFLRRCLSEVQRMGDNWVIDELGRQAHDKGLETGLEKGQAKEARRAVLRVLRRRFGVVPEEVQDRMERLAGLEQLENLLDWAVDCPSLEAFQVRLAND